MKILLCGVFLDGSGYSTAVNDYAMAMDSVGLDVVCRPIRLSSTKVDPPRRIQELIGKSSKGADILIQHVLPSMMAYSGSFRRCIGLYAWETSHFRQSTWADRLNLMDEVWVINRQMVESARASGVNRPIQVVPHTSNIERFQRSYKDLDILKMYKRAGEFLFYTVGEFTHRKNLVGLLRAFHAEFDPSEPVRLVIKTSIPGVPAQDALRMVNECCQDVWRLMNMGGNRKTEVVITGRLTDEDMLKLHSTCDCFVQPSFGEAFSQPAFDSMAMGKTPIVSASTGYLEYMSDKVGWLVDCREEPVFNVQNGVPDVYTGRESWWSPSLLRLRKCMRQAYEDRPLRLAKARAGVERAYDFSYRAIGETIKGLLNVHLQRDSRTMARARSV